MNLRFATLLFLLLLPVWSHGADPVPLEKGPAKVLMSFSPWVGLEPEFKGKFRTGVQTILSGGNPFSVYDPKVEAAKRNLVEQIRKIDSRQATSPNFVARVEHIEEVANKYSFPEKGETITDFKVHFKLKDGSKFWMVVSADPATLEAQTMPVTFEDMKLKYQDVLDLYLYKAGASVGLHPRVELGSNHFHLGTATAFYKNEVIPVKILDPSGGVKEIITINRPVEEYANIFRDYAVSIFNNPSLAYFADDGYIFTNAPHSTWFDGLTESLQKVIAKWDEKPTSIQTLAKQIQNAYVKYSPLKASEHTPEKYVFYNLTRTANSPSDYGLKKFDQLSIPSSFNSMDDFTKFMKESGLEDFYRQTTEARGIGGQGSLKKYMAIVGLYFDRLEYVRAINQAGKGKIPLQNLGAPFSSSHGASQLLYFVRETYEGLGYPREEIISKWKTLADLIRRRNLRDAALSLKPYELSLDDLRKVAYHRGPKNYYRRDCTWLFQKAMTLIPDGK
jgi:hypothetical protein